MTKFLLLLIATFSLFFNEAHSQMISFGKFTIGESKIRADLSDFKIIVKNPNISAEWVPGTVQWIRNENNLLVPRALLKIIIKQSMNELHIESHNSIIIPAKKDNYYETQVYIDLFNPEQLLVYSASELLDKISIVAEAVADARSKQLIDYSCAPYDLKIEGIDTEYLSVGCKMNRLGTFANEYPRLEITMNSTNLRTLNNSKPPYVVYLEDNSPVDLKMKGLNQQTIQFKLSAKLPKRLHRLKTSVGYGPYIYESEYQTDKQSANFAPSLMVYAKYELTDTSSIKAFDALLYSKSRFNNSGLYFSYDLADAFDGRVLINALLGFQGIHYKFEKNAFTEFRLIYPQGFEVIYKHAFLLNYHLFYGMFISTNNIDSYTNAWLRYGKSSFIELNYIDWGHEKNHMKMIGLSVGIPFFNAF